MRQLRLSGFWRQRIDMRLKEEKCVVTFRTAAAAMEMERICKAEEIPGRLIPVPRAITAGCGMCWAAPPSAQEQLEELVMEKHLMIDGIYSVVI